MSETYKLFETFSDFMLNNEILFAIKENYQVFILKDRMLKIEYLQVFAEKAYLNKSTIFIYLSHWTDDSTPMIMKMLLLGNMFIEEPENEFKLFKKIKDRKVLRIEIKN
jgi:hypothetical protein